MPISQESAAAIREGIKVLESQKSEILEKVNQTQEEIDNLTVRRDQIKSQADAIDESISRMNKDLEGT